MSNGPIVTPWFTSPNTLFGISNTTITSSGAMSMSPTPIRQRLQGIVQNAERALVESKNRLEQAKSELEKLDSYDTKTIELYDKLVSQNLIKNDYIINNEFKTLDTLQQTIDQIVITTQFKAL